MERLKGKQFEYEIIKDTARMGYYFSNSDVVYSPHGWAKVNNLWYPLGYKAVTEDLRSLGLRKNNNILQYCIGEWTKLKTSDLIKKDVDEGGIFSGVNLSAIRKTEESCMKRQKYPFKPRIFYAAIYNPIFVNGYKVKSQGVMLLEELG